MMIIQMRTTNETSSLSFYVETAEIEELAEMQWTDAILHEREIKWNGTKIYRREASDIDPPASGYKRCHCSIDVEIRGKLLKVILTETIMKGIESAAETLFKELGCAVSMRECMTWINATRRIRDIQIDRADAYTGPMPTIRLNGDFWALPKTVKGKTGWSVEGERAVDIVESDSTTEASAQAVM